MLFAAGALVSVGAAVHAQERPREEARTERGWIGISFDVSSDRWGRAHDVLIAEVSAGSPAEEAGLRAGDRLVRINDMDRPEELALLSERLRLRAGDRVVVEIDRDGDRRRLQLRAARRPDDFVAGRHIEVSLRADSMVETWVRAMDSLRAELVATRSVESARVDRVAPPSGRQHIAIVTGESGRPVKTPFEFFVFRGEAHDSLLREMAEITHTVAELETRLATRERELREGRPRNEADLVRDPELRRLQSALERASARSAALEGAMADAALSIAGFDNRYRVRGEAPEARVSVISERPPETREFRPLTPYLLGRNRVAGAEVIDLRPELAEYFDVEQGVLVVDVAPGTPAAMAGIVPGDVITRMDQVGVRSVEDFRFGVSTAEGSLPVTLIRQGSSRQVLLRK